MDDEEVAIAATIAASLKDVEGVASSDYEVQDDDDDDDENEDDDGDGDDEVDTDGEVDVQVVDANDDDDDNTFGEIPPRDEHVDIR